MDLRAPLLSLAVLVASAGAVLHAPAAHADADGEITVVLKTGVVVRGTLIERVPGEHVLLRLATGETRKIRWSEIASDSYGKAPEPTTTPTPTPTPAPTPTPTMPTPPPTATAPTYAPYPAPPMGGALVHVEAKPGVLLERFVVYGTSTRWEPVCAAPCDRPMAPGTYRVNGKGMRSSPEFAVGTQPVHVRAQLGSLAGMITGISLTGLGGLCLLTGGLAALTFDDEPRYPGDSGSSAGKTAFTTFAVIGGIMLAVGLPLWLLNGRSVEVDGREVALRLDDKGLVRLTPRGLVF